MAVLEELNEVDRLGLEIQNKELELEKVRLELLKRDLSVEHLPEMSDKEESLKKEISDFYTKANNHGRSADHYIQAQKDKEPAR